MTNRASIEFQPRRQSTDELVERDFSKSVDSLYVHVPFCTAKCHFCDFVIVPGVLQADSSRRYVHALLEEMNTYVAARGSGEARDVSKMQVGGGTPTLLVAADLRRLLDRLQELVTGPSRSGLIEGFPSSITTEKCVILAECSWMQVNVGIQSFDHRVLRAVGRHVASSEGESAVERLQSSGVASVGVDLIYGMPSSTDETARRDAARAIALGVQHVTLYPLWLYEGTPLERRVRLGRVDVPDLCAVESQRETMDGLLVGAGYVRYTSFHYRRDPSDEHAYGTGAMAGDDWWGFGQAAVSQQGGRVWENQRSLHGYLSDVERGSSPARVIAAGAVSEEFRAVSYGLRAGFYSDVLHFRRFGSSVFKNFGSAIEKMVVLGLLEADSESVRLTGPGIVRIGEVEEALFDTVQGRS